MMSRRRVAVRPPGCWLKVRLALAIATGAVVDLAGLSGKAVGRQGARPEFLAYLDRVDAQLAAAGVVAEVREALQNVSDACWRGAHASAEWTVAEEEVSIPSELLGLCATLTKS